MKATNKSATGTSFYNSTLKCSIDTLFKVLGEPIDDSNTGEDKTNFEWIMETSRGDVFTVYDWKEYRSLNYSDVIEWHIGGMSKQITDLAKQEIRESIVKI